MKALETIINIDISRVLTLIKFDIILILNNNFIHVFKIYSK
jgi:hypothetical protein